MRIAIVGTGYVTDGYMKTLTLHPELQIAGVWDLDADRLATFAAHHEVRAYASYAEVLADPSVGIVVNLTNPRSHWEVSSQALDAGKHVYSEKPLAMTMEDARDLCERAERNGVILAGAPCNHLGEAAQHLRETLRDRAEVLGRPLLVYAAMDDGMIPALQPETWLNELGFPWPARDEYEVGCTLEHAGYQIAPMVAMFGPVRAVTAFNATLLPDKVVPYGGTVISPDFSVGMLEFDNGVVARLTHSILAPEDRSLRVVCEHGVLTLSDVWEYDAPVRYRPTGLSRAARLHRRAEWKLHSTAPGLVLGRRVKEGTPLRSSKKDPLGRLGLFHRMDFARGIARLAALAEQGGTAPGEAALALHVTEVTLALSASDAVDGRREMTSAAALDAATSSAPL